MTTYIAGIECPPPPSSGTPDVGKYIYLAKVVAPLRLVYDIAPPLRGLASRGALSLDLRVRNKNSARHETSLVGDSTQNMDREGPTCTYLPEVSSDSHSQLGPLSLDCCCTQRPGFLELKGLQTLKHTFCLLVPPLST